jgi:hypothetical protein
MLHRIGSWLAPVRHPGSVIKPGGIDTRKGRLPPCARNSGNC